VLRRVTFVALLSGALAASASTEPPVQLLPGVTFQKQVEFTPQGPVVIDVITGPKPGGLYAVVPALAHGSVGGGLEPVTWIEQEASTVATVAGINGDSFTSKGYPTGIFLQNGVLEHGADSSRASVGIDSGGMLHVKRVSFVGTWKGAGQRRPLSGINQIPRSGQVVLFTPAWGSSTPFVAGSTEVVLEPFPAAAPNTDLRAPVTAQATDGGTPIPQDGAVLMSLGSSSGLPVLQTDAPQDGNVTVRLILPSDWATVGNAIGGGPVLVNGGRTVFHTGESFDAGALAQRDARAGVGQLADGRILFVAVDGNQPGYSAGISIYELARTMARLGAVTAAAVESGPSVTAAFDGQLLSRPRTPGGRAVKDALLLEYFGVSALPPAVAALGKNNVSAGEQLAYRIVRPSSVNALVTSPTGETFTLDSGARQPGTYQFTWSTFDTEGTWHWNIRATDDQGQVSVADQPFHYDLTLSALIVPKTVRQKAGFVARFQLSRPATVTLRIETPAGTIVRTLPQEQLQAGHGLLRWDGTLADAQTTAYPGSYVARVAVTSEVGTMDLAAPFTLRS
jgi:hypothetical protein